MDSLCVLIPKKNNSLTPTNRVKLPEKVLNSILDKNNRSVPFTPLTFKISTCTFSHNRVLDFKSKSSVLSSVYVGVEEFSAPEGTIILPNNLYNLLGIPEDKYENENEKEKEIKNENLNSYSNDLESEISCASETQVFLKITVNELPKGTSVTLTPLENAADYVDNWKSLLEAKLREQYTTLTCGEIIEISGVGKMLVKKTQPDSNAICIVDTDLEVDLAFETQIDSTKNVTKNLNKYENINSNGNTNINTPITEKLNINSNLQTLSVFSQNIRKVTFTDVPSDPEFKNKYILIELNSDPNIKGIRNLFLDADDDVSEEIFQWSTLENDKVIVPINALKKNLYCKILNSIPMEMKISLQIITKDEIKNIKEANATLESETGLETKSESIKCSNCHKFIPLSAFNLHSATCQRLNVPCLKGCNKIFNKREGGIPSSHWHCDKCSKWGDSGKEEKDYHYYMFHTPICCPYCANLKFESRIELARHRATTCQEKLHICKFCHLLLPRGVTSLEDSFMGWSGHEASCGSRTTECPVCSVRIRIRDIDTHMLIHVSERKNEPLPQICSNANCIKIIDNSSNNGITNGNILSLCSSCFGSFYSSVYDPDYKKLWSRVERRYFIQLSGGCKKPWCQNPYCLTINGKKLSSKDIISTVSQLISKGKEYINNKNKNTKSENDNGQCFYFCVDESTTKRKLMVDWIADEGKYCREWCARAIEETRGHEDKARDWMQTHANSIIEQQA